MPFSLEMKTLEVTISKEMVGNFSGNPTIKLIIKRGSTTQTSNYYQGKHIGDTKTGSQYRVKLPEEEKYEQPKASFVLDTKTKLWKEKTFSIEVKYKWPAEVKKLG